MYHSMWDTSVWKICISCIMGSKMGSAPTQTWSEIHKMKVIYKISAQGEKCEKLCSSSILSSKRGLTPTKINEKWWQSIDPKFIKWKLFKILLYMSKQVWEYRGKLYYQNSAFHKGHFFYNNWRIIMTLVVKLMNWKSLTKSQLNMSQHIGVKLWKLCISSIQSSERGTGPTRLDANWGHSNSSKRGKTPTKIVAKWRHSNSFCKIIKTKL